MGDHPSKRSRTGNELTDQIYEPPLKHVRHLLLKLKIGPINSQGNNSIVFKKKKKN